MAHVINLDTLPRHEPLTVVLGGEEYTSKVLSVLEVGAFMTEMRKAEQDSPDQVGAILLALIEALGLPTEKLIEAAGVAGALQVVEGFYSALRAGPAMKGKTQSPRPRRSSRASGRTSSASKA